MNCDKCEDTGYTNIELVYGPGGFSHKMNWCDCPEGQRLKKLHIGQREQVIDAKRKGEDNRYDPRMEGEKL